MMPLDSSSRALVNDVVEAARAGELVLFVGAGTSVAAKLPTWSQLARILLKEMEEAKAPDSYLREIERYTQQGKLIDALDAVNPPYS